MPIYEYQCQQCEGVFEAIQRFSDDPLTQCRLCGNEGVRKLLSAPAFRLKGSGWYETDFKKDKQRNVAKGDTDSASKSSSASASTGGDSKSKSDSGSSSETKTPSKGASKPDAA